MKKNIKFCIPNPLAIFLYRLRMIRAVRKWNNDVPFIESKCLSPGDHFKWGQLIWQEIKMWISIGDPYLPPSELQWLSERRGFDNDQQEYLKTMMKYVWMWRQKSNGY
jgi:hypothetical protein